MGEGNRSTAMGCGILTLLLLGVPVILVSIVGVRTWIPLNGAGESLDQLERDLGDRARYTPLPSGDIPAERLELFLDLRTSLMAACSEYGSVQTGFESVAELDSTDSVEAREVANVFGALGRAAFAITPFLAQYFELRNDALLAASMGLEEYAYIYAVAYHDHLLSEQIRNEIFSNGEALSEEASEMLRNCLARQLQEVSANHESNLWYVELEAELKKMETDPSRLVWQEGLPVSLNRGLMPFREQFDQVFCGATAGLEMERGARRALKVALE